MEFTEGVKLETEAIHLKSEQAIKAWANTTFILRKDGIIRVKKHPEGIFYFFALENNEWVMKVSSKEPYFFDGEEMVN